MAVQIREPCIVFTYITYNLDFEMDSEIYIAFSIGNQLFFSVVPIFFFLYWKAI